MTATIEEIQNDMARLLRLAVRGEEIVITQAGRPVAKLTGIAQHPPQPDRQEWLESLRQLRERTSTGQPGKTTDEILAQDRAERA